MKMAYSNVKITIEIGHEASVRNKRTPEGFTHDWEVFVRGPDNADIYHFIDKVVFHLHETFPKPKRTIKEPPYVVKESGYAGFTLPIDIYLKNNSEPRKVKFTYDLNLQPAGPPIKNITKERYVFSNPNEDFRRKLIRGGGVGVLGSEGVGSVGSSSSSGDKDSPLPSSSSSSPLFFSLPPSL
uniref:Protein AF-9 n=1 Tax=Cacopsylla melanoneura TaxID=428564 RepID=A0A8D8LUE4_9HEMI